MYNEVKLSFLLPVDIEQFKRLQELIVGFPQAKSHEDLVDVESEISILIFTLNQTVSRLMSQLEYGKRDIENRVSIRSLEIIDEIRSENPDSRVGVKGVAEKRAEDEFLDERQALSVQEQIVNEYRGKLFATKEVMVAISHRLHKLRNEKTE